MNIGIIGVGGVGGYFGGKLAQLLNNSSRKKDLKIYFIARNKHLKEIKKNGLMISTKDEGEFISIPTLATDNFDELPELDFCLICVKSYDLQKVLISLKTKINNNTIIIPLLNGVDIYDRIRAITEKGIVHPACVYVGTHIEKYGKISQSGGSCSILFGKDPNHPESIPKEAFKLFDESNIKYKWLDNCYSEIWSKYIFIAAYGMVTSAENKTIGQIIENEKLSETVKKIMNEIAQIAKMNQIYLPPTIVQDSFEKGKSFPYETKTSFQRDYEQKDKLNESELFGDTIIRLGKLLGLDTPVTKKTNTKL